LIPTAISAGASRVASGLLCVHAVAITPAGSMELVRSSVSIASGLPRVTVRSAPAIVFSRPAQRSLTLRPARSPSRHATLYTESSDSSVASAAASIATGWSEPAPGRELHPLKSSAFPGALLRQQSPTRPVGKDHNQETLAGYAGVPFIVITVAILGAPTNSRALPVSRVPGVTTSAIMDGR
jgi:hypothetical protein